MRTLLQGTPEIAVGNTWLAHQVLIRSRHAAGVGAQRRRSGPPSERRPAKTVGPEEALPGSGPGPHTAELHKDD